MWCELATSLRSFTEGRSVMRMLYCRKLLFRIARRMREFYAELAPRGNALTLFDAPEKLHHSEVIVIRQAIHRGRRQAANPVHQRTLFHYHFQDFLFSFRIK